MNTKMLKATALASVVLPGMAMVSGSTLAQDGAITSDLDASIRLGVEFTTEPEVDIGIANYQSRIRWAGSADMDAGGSIISYLELSVDEDTGIDNTRHAWVGLTGDSGTVKIGKQHTALYDAVTSKIDVANWASCLFELQCSRQSSVLKYSSVPNDGLQLHGSTQLILEGDGGEILNGFDLAATMENDGLNLGAGLSYIGDGIGRADNGFALSVGASMDVGAGSASAALSYATDDYVQDADDAISFTGTYTQGSVYGVVGLASSSNDPFYLTAGYTKPLIADRAYVFFEVGLSDDGAPLSDTDLSARTVLVFNFGKSYSSEI